MTEYLSSKPFSVQQRGRPASTCGHGWLDKNGRCVFCGELPETPYGRSILEDEIPRQVVRNTEELAHLVEISEAMDAVLAKCYGNVTNLTDA